MVNVSYYNVSVRNFADIVSYNAIFPYAYDITLLVLFAIVFMVSRKLTFSLFITSIASYILLSLNFVSTIETGLLFSLTIASFLIDLYKAYKEQNETYGLEKIG
jgi:hypothetical protein